MKEKEVYAIVNPEGNIVNLELDKYKAWYNFFNNHLHKLPLATAIAAYEAIGYKRKKFKLVEVE
jgi:hypothetical protein